MIKSMKQMLVVTMSMLLLLMTALKLLKIILLMSALYSTMVTVSCLIIVSLSAQSKSHCSAFCFFNTTLYHNFLPPQRHFSLLTSEFIKYPSYIIQSIRYQRCEKVFFRDLQSLIVLMLLAVCLVGNKIHKARISGVTRLALLRNENFAKLWFIYFFCF